MNNRLDTNHRSPKYFHILLYFGARTVPDSMKPKASSRRSRISTILYRKRLSVSESECWSGYSGRAVGKGEDHKI
jgi:hypothetical protein